MKRILKISFGLTVLLLLALPAQAGYLVVKRKPVRPKIVGVKPAAPRAGFVWVGGHWTVRAGRYVWVSGSWTKPHAGSVWVNGHWKKVRGGWTWVPGHWKRVKPGRTIIIRR